MFIQKITKNRKDSKRAHINHPSSLLQLRNLILQANRMQSEVHLTETLHVYPTLNATNELHINLDKLNRVLEFDKKSLKVRVEGGLKVGDLLNALAEKHVTLPTQVYNRSQSIARALAVDSYAAWGHSNTSCIFILEIEIIDSKGNLYKITPKKNSHIFSGLVVNLGCLGIVYSLLLQCIPLEILKLTKVRTSFANISNNIQNYLEDNVSFQICKDPYSENLITCCYSRTNDLVGRQWHHSFKNKISKLATWFCYHLFKVPYWLMPYTSAVQMYFSPISNYVNYSHLILSPEVDQSYREQEVALPFEYFDTALELTHDLIRRYESRKERPLIALTIRFVGADCYGYMSPARKTLTVYITLVSIAANSNSNLFQDWEDAMILLNGKPHWGKHHFLTKDKVQKIYGQDYFKFLEVMSGLNPFNLISNKSLKDIFS